MVCVTVLWSLVGWVGAEPRSPLTVLSVLSRRMYDTQLSMTYSSTSSYTTSYTRRRALRAAASARRLRLQLLACSLTTPTCHLIVSRHEVRARRRPRAHARVALLRAIIVVCVAANMSGPTTPQVRCGDSCGSCKACLCNLRQQRPRCATGIVRRCSKWAPTLWI